MLKKIRELSAQAVRSQEEGSGEPPKRELDTVPEILRGSGDLPTLGLAAQVRKPPLEAEQAWRPVCRTPAAAL